MTVVVIVLAVLLALALAALGGLAWWIISVFDNMWRY